MDLCRWGSLWWAGSNEGSFELDYKNVYVGVLPEGFLVNPTLSQKHVDEVIETYRSRELE
jgi:hypothetical protein